MEADDPKPSSLAQRLNDAEIGLTLRDGKAIVTNDNGEQAFWDDDWGCWCDEMPERP